MEKVTFTTTDGVQLVGNYFPPVPPRDPLYPSICGVLCLHMMPATKESWNELAIKLSENRFHVLAIDERGHGESCTQQKHALDYQTFSDTEQQAKRLDVDASLTWLASKGLDLKQTVVVGASIGANLSLDALVRYPQLPSAVLLSPGLDYRGIKTDDLATQLRPHQSVLLIASQDDQYSFQTIETLDQLIQVQHELKKFQAGDHGTRLFQAYPELVQEVASWIQTHG